MGTHYNFVDSMRKLFINKSYFAEIIVSFKNNENKQPLLDIVRNNI